MRFYNLNNGRELYHGMDYVNKMTYEITSGLDFRF